MRLLFLSISTNKLCARNKQRAIPSAKNKWNFMYVFLLIKRMLWQRKIHIGFGNTFSSDHEKLGRCLSAVPPIILLSEVGLLSTTFGRFWAIAPSHAGVSVLPALGEVCDVPQNNWDGRGEGFKYYYTEVCKEILLSFIVPVTSLFET